MKKTNFKAILLILILTSLVYANCLGNFFAMDDFMVIVENDFVKSWNNIPAFFTKDYLTSPSDGRYLGMYEIGSGELTYRPVVTLSYFIDYSIWKLNAFGYHFTNLFLHILNAIMLYFFIGLIIKNKKIGLLAALLFAVHPVNIEPVNSISFREDLFVFLFFITSFMFYVKMDFCHGRKKAYFYIASIVLFLLALFSKEVAVVLPIVLVLYDYFFVARDKTRSFLYRLRTRYIGFVLAVLFYLWIWVLFKSYMKEGLVDFSYRGGNFYTNALTMLSVFVRYIGWLLWPINVHPTLPGTDPVTLYSIFQAQALFSAIVVVGFLIFAVMARKKLKEVSFSIFWFFICLLPVSNIYPISNVVAPRFLYIPAIGFFLIAALFLYRLPRMELSFISRRVLKKITTYTVITLILFYSMFTIIKNFLWKNDFVLWQELVERYPDNPNAHKVLAQCYLRAGLLDKAIAESKIAVRLDPLGSYSCYIVLGGAYYKKGMMDQAIVAYEKALELDPGSIDAYNNLICAYGFKGKYKQAIHYFEQGIKFDPRYIPLYINMGSTYVRMKDWDKAKEVWERALEFSPNNREIISKIDRLKSIAR